MSFVIVWHLRNNLRKLVFLAELFFKGNKRGKKEMKIKEKTRADAFFWLLFRDYRFLVTSGRLLSRKVWWAVRIGSLCLKLRYLIDQNFPKENEFFAYFEIKKWILQTVRVEWVYGKNGVIFLASMFSSSVMVLKLSKKMYFLQSCAGFVLFTIYFFRCNCLLHSFLNLEMLKIHFHVVSRSVHSGL